MEMTGIAFGTDETETRLITEDSITMADVVSFATMELQQKEQELLVSDYFGDPEQKKTHFNRFEDHNNARIAESEKVGLDRLVMEGNEVTQFMRTAGSSIDESDIISWNHLKALLDRGLSPEHDGSVAEADSDEIYRLYRLMEDSGGYLVVRVENDDAAIVRDLWSTMEKYFALPESVEQTDLQVLEKKDGSHDPKAGYIFCQTYMNANGQVLPETIQNALGGTRESHNGIVGSLTLFANICKTVGTIAAAGALEKDLALMSKVVTSMLDEKSGHPFVNVDHRLSQYRTGPEDIEQQTAKESLISHTDWTFTTCIPLSAVPGLQLWEPRSKEWVVPEEHLAEERTNYVVVMSGKWMELLTHQKLKSCVHRVVTNPSQDSTARLSAPFFCRTKKYLFDTVQDRFHTRPTSLSQEAAIDEMGRGFFGDLVRFIEGSRDPAIPGCVVDICMDKGDSIPECRSIEEVLG